MNTSPDFRRPGSVPRIPTLRAALVAAISVPLTACVLDSPYFGQTFASTTTAIPIQAWTGDNNRTVRIECSKAYHAGIYPWGGPEVWLPVADLTPSAVPSYDPNGGVTYSAGIKQALPAACWYADNAYTPPKYMTALRATQLNANGSTVTFRVFDAGGLECKGREVGKSRSWTGWVNAGCALTYSNSTTLLPWVRISSNTLGVAAMAAAAPTALTRKGEPPSSMNGPGADEMARAFDSEATDKTWAEGMQHQLLLAFSQTHPEGTDLQSASCRQTMCQVIVVHDDEAALGRFAAALAPYGLYSGDGQRGRRYDLATRAGLGAVYYLARDDHSLPGTGPR